ncbi:MAG: hypothetical protein KDD61_16705 [Bdellovibrionales bacterium]|nr:hypothetical protein [Bdellovibrionales bacterium]
MSLLKIRHLKRGSLLVLLITTVTACSEFKAAQLERRDFIEPKAQCCEPPRPTVEGKQALQESRAKVSVLGQDIFRTELTVERVGILADGSKAPLQFRWDMTRTQFESEYELKVMTTTKDLAGYSAQIYYNREFGVMVVMVQDSASTDMTYSSLATLYLQVKMDQGEMVASYNENYTEIFDFSLIHSLGPETISFKEAVAGIPKVLDLLRTLPAQPEEAMAPNGMIAEPTPAPQEDSVNDIAAAREQALSEFGVEGDDEFVGPPTPTQAEASVEPPPIAAEESVAPMPVVPEAQQESPGSSSVQEDSVDANSPLDNDAQTIQLPIGQEED